MPNLVNGRFGQRTFRSGRFGLHLGNGCRSAGCIDEVVDDLISPDIEQDDHASHNAT